MATYYKPEDLARFEDIGKAYTQACLEKGSNLAEMTEAVHVVTAIRGGASLVHGIQMRNIAHKLSM